MSQRRQSETTVTLPRFVIFLPTLLDGLAIKAIRAMPAGDVARLAAGIFGGLGIGASALAQGRAGASAADALGETGKGFVNYLMVIGIVETVALFVMVFLMTTLR